MLINHAGRTRRVEPSRAELWTWPAAGAMVSAVAAFVLVTLRPAADDRGTRTLWPGDVASAVAMLQTVAGAVITVTTLTFTLTVIALQLASQQFSPRLLRDFLRDRVTKAVLALLVGTFVYTLVVLRSIDATEPLPQVAMLGAFGLGLASLAGVIAFISHVARVLRVDTMMLMAHDEASAAIREFYPAYGDVPPHVPEDIPHGTDVRHGELVVAVRSGFVRVIDLHRLIGTAQTADAVVRVIVRPGDHVVKGTPIAQVWARESAGDITNEVGAAVQRAVALDYERTIEQDAAFGFRQLQDIAVKAMSPAINDPVTAIHAIGHMTDLLVSLCDRRLGPTLHADDDDVPRVIVLDRDLRYYLDLSCSQIRRYGAREPTVLARILGLLRDVAVAARDDTQRAEVERQIDFVLAQLPDRTDDEDARQVHEMARRVRLALEGEVREAFHDRTGETRSV